MKRSGGPKVLLPPPLLVEFLRQELPTVMTTGPLHGTCLSARNLANAPPMPGCSSYDGQRSSDAVPSGTRPMSLLDRLSCSSD